MSELEYQEQLKKYLESLDSGIFGVDRVSVISIKRLGGGLHNVNYLVELDGLPPRKLVVRFHPKNNPGEDKTAIEASNMRLLDGLRVPRIIFVGVPEFLGSTVMCMEFIEGTSADFRTLSDEKIRMLARATAEVHSIKRDMFSRAPSAPASEHGTYADYLSTMIKSTITDRLTKVRVEIYQDSQALIARGLEKCNDYLAREEFTGSRFSLLHTDLGEGNVIWSSGEPTIIDWEEITFGDPADEVAYIFAINNLDTQWQSTFLDEYLRAMHDESLTRRIPAYILKNRLFDLRWSISKMAELQSGESPEMLHGSIEEYRGFYNVRRDALEALLRSM